jgi:hypothetical protein
VNNYDQLVQARKSCRKCTGLINPAEEQFDGCEIGPWSRWLASRPADLILVRQDWGTAGYFRDHRGRDTPENRTNERLTRFLALLGFKVGPADCEDRQSGVFATNAFLCLKQGETLSVPVRHEWYENCRHFLKGTIDVVAAPTVIALGKCAYRAVARAYDIGPLPFRDAIEQASPLQLDRHRRAFAVFHPAARPVNRTLDQMADDWLRIKSVL